MTRLLSLIVICLPLGASVAQGALVTTFFDSGRFGYTGTWTRYATLGDAQTSTNPTEFGSMPQRDIAFYVTQNIPENSPFDPSYIILTRWYDPDSGNPSNTNEGFFQYYDDNSSTLMSLNSYWNAALTAFTLQAHSENADYAGDFARFGERAGGPGTDTEAFFHVMDIDLTVNGLVGSYNSLTGRYEGTDTASASINGTISGIVENVGTNATRHGFYVFELTLNDTSWAVENGHVETGDLIAYSVAAVPESPLTFVLLLSLIPVGMLAQRLWKKQLTPADALAC